MRRVAFVLVPAILAGFAFSCFAATTPIQLRDYRALVRIKSPRFSPDGNRIAFLAVRANFADDRYDAALNTLDTANGRSRVLVNDMRDLRMPRWSPDGKTLAFLAKAGKDKSQLYTVSAAGGKARKITRAPNGIEQFAWSPDGRTIAYVTPDASPIGKKDRKTHHDLFVIHDDDYQIQRPAVPSHIWLLTLKSGKTRQFTHGSTSVLEARPPFGGGISAPVWSPDGRWIVYTRQANADDSDSDRTRIMAVNIATGKQHPLTDKTRYEYNPHFAPKGDAIAYLHIHGPGAVSDMDLCIGSATKSGAHDASADLDRNLLPGFAWLPDGSGLVAIADNRVGTKLYVQPLRGKGHGIRLGKLNPSSVAVSSTGALAVVAENARKPPELYLMETQNSAPKQLTHFNSRFKAYSYPRSVEVQWQAPDGENNDGILTYPDGYRRGKQYPLVLFSHGGPEYAAGEGFDNREIGPLRDLFAAEGYLVFEPNYRGSDNLGNAHEHAIYRDPGTGPNSDVMSGLKMLEQRGLVDKSRICAVGHSYGGYMTAWLISHQHFWRCAVVADGAVDWTEEYELAGTGNLAWTRDSLGGTPWDKQSAKLYRTGSPLTYAGQITTPTLILSGTADLVVPITESFGLYHALASRHIPVKFIGIPGAHHTPQDPVHLELYYQAINRWVKKHLGP